MRYYQSWQDYTRRPEVKQLIESRGMNFVRQQYQREVNFLEWNDPVIINETNQPGLSVSNPAAQGDNSVGSTQFITGYSKEESTITFAAGLAPGISGSIHGTFIDAHALETGTDFSRNHTNTTKTFRLYITTGSAVSFTNTAGADCVLTASVDALSTPDVSGSILSQWRDAINNQGSTATVAGFTNTIAPSTLISGSVEGRVLTITRTNKGGVPDIGISAGSATENLSDTASVATPINGQDTYHFAPGSQVFDGTQLPYAAMPRK